MARMNIPKKLAAKPAAPHIPIPFGCVLNPSREKKKTSYVRKPSAEIVILDYLLPEDVQQRAGRAPASYSS